ncbi:hypothetical protein [Flavobacterium aquiphilum]|uniref:hypothetical protein n=1 Tax=Flavobacterium aquiphilum TaxID=3003261 RepID=UPI0024818F63|nr:hypothetical protein [Flavobacterium aquiphilum]
MIITYYFAGLLSGVSIASFFIGKELYRYYIKNKVQEKKIHRLLKLNEKIKNSLLVDYAENQG